MPEQPQDEESKVVDAREASPALFRRLQSKDFSVRTDAVELLGWAASGNDEATQAVITALQDKDHQVQVSAIWATAWAFGVTSERASQFQLLLLFTAPHSYPRT